MKTVAEQLSAQVREGELYEKLDSQPRALLRLRPLLPHSGRLRGRLQGALQPRRQALRALRLRERAARGSHREEALLSRPARHPRAQLRHAGLRPALRILPELGDLAGPARFPLFAGFPPASRPREIVRSRAGLPAPRSVVSTYNEPLITSEWAVAVFREARAAGLVTGFVSNGNATPQVLEYLRPWVDLYKVDLKSFDDRHYHELGGRLGPILDSIRRIHEMGFWLEVVTLVVPGFNDSRRGTDGHRGIPGGHLAGHPLARDGVSRRLQDVRAGQYRARPRCSARRRSARRRGCVTSTPATCPGQLRKLEDTHCPRCRAVVIERRGFQVLRNRLTEEGQLSRIAAPPVPGVWRGAAARIRAKPRLLLNGRCG